MKFLLWLAANAAALLVAIWLFDGITLHADTRSDQIIQLLLTGGIFGAVNSLVKPAVKFLSFPFIILSLGLLLFVINALMLMLTSRIADTLGMGFHVNGFWTAVWGSIVISLVGLALERLLPDRD
jgi:putative membrane protein